MKWILAEILTLAIWLKPLSALPAPNERAGLHVLKTTTTDDGQIIDWVLRSSQGDIATPPPAPQRVGTNVSQPDLDAILASHPNLRGPEGAVPLPRKAAGTTGIIKRLPKESDDGSAKLATRQSNAGAHWYSSTAQAVNNHGSNAYLSMFKAYTQSGGDFSLLQTAVIRYNVPTSNGGTTSQTLEAGWINYPNQVAQPHLFTYFTTVGYSAEGDNIGGWNRDHAGWVQYDSTVYPGYQFGQISTDGGTQYDLDIQFLLDSGNWWLWVVDRWIGYYPANIFTKGVASSGTLETMSNQVNWYGEIYNSETTVTTTDMGSGRFAETGFSHAGYIHNIQYVDTSGNQQIYDGSAQVIVSDTSRYDIQTFWRSATTWGSYFYLGGPGAGGVTNG